MFYSNNRVLQILLILFSILIDTVHTQSIENLLIRQTEDSLTIDYDIYGGREYDLYKIDLSISSDGGKTFAINPKLPKGDVGYGISRGRSKRIVWEPLNENQELVGDKYLVKLNGSLIATSNKIEFIEIKGGAFEMGDVFEEGHTDETFIHKVTIDDYEISKFEVTNNQYATFLKEYKSSEVKSGEFHGEIMIYEHEIGLKYIQNEWQPIVGYEYHPVVGVTWFGANEFCRYYDMRLPTEAEWEFAAREMGKKVRFGNGGDVASTLEINFNGQTQSDSVYWRKGENRGRTVSAGGFPPNTLQLFQMSGNVWEWCQDWYASNSYHQSKEHNPSGPWMGNYKVIRGGSWFNSADAVRVYERSFLAPNRYASDIGFRPVRSNSSQQ